MPERDEKQEETQRQVAYQLWEKAGKPEGRQDDFWKQAEMQLSQHQRQALRDDVDRDSKDSFPASDPPSHT